ncbi:MAG: hypothetical protein FRX48_01669 [Lasallia pustulata]|uniref:Uncharacterized protein n=1 Tax=Lasallia pustulata TaxID=136370 RepID=A0A5M8PYN9_9LECA|nr:MAG: hypothetical protein FRX48_01669 [Lasallia pustulata]
MALFLESFPSLKSTARINSFEKRIEATQFFDCKFYPYTAAGVDPVFAVVGKRETIICRPLKSKNAGFEVLRWFQDDDPNVDLNSLAWSRDLTTGDPLICVAGKDKPSIDVLNVKTGQLVKTLIGHGKDIEDLAVSPLSPSILASVSMDHSVRFWSLDSAHEKQPCMLICAGEGHKEGILTMAFHHTGRYLLTGGHDSVVNLWVIPELPDENVGTDKLTRIHYPHFSTSAIHTNYVDCVAWYDDLILSKCADSHMIVLWRIEGFSSDNPPPPASTAPTAHTFTPTRSAFGGGYQRLLEFDCKETTSFYIRFSLFHRPWQRPMLVIGNENSKVYFWDLQRLEDWTEADDIGDGGDGFKVPLVVKKKHAGGRPRLKQREPSVTSTTTSGSLAPRSEDSGEAVADMTAPKSRKRYGVEDPFKPLQPHQTVVVPKVLFASRQTAWSVGGEWMVVVGDQGMIAVFHR